MTRPDPETLRTDLGHITPEGAGRPQKLRAAQGRPQHRRDRRPREPVPPGRRAAPRWRRRPSPKSTASGLSERHTAPKHPPGTQNTTLAAFRRSAPRWRRHPPPRKAPHQAPQSDTQRQNILRVLRTPPWPHFAAQRPAGAAIPLSEKRRIRPPERHTAPKHPPGTQFHHPGRISPLSAFSGDARSPDNSAPPPRNRAQKSGTPKGVPGTRKRRAAQRGPSPQTTMPLTPLCSFEVGLGVRRLGSRSM